MTNPNKISTILNKINPKFKFKKSYIIYQKHNSIIYRILTENNTFIVKVFQSKGEAKEINCYSLLQEYNVPTLSVYGKTEKAILLEDLNNSLYWRLANEDDVSNEDVGRAVAKWYLKFHSAGKNILNSKKQPDFLEREIDGLNAKVLFKIGEKYGLNKYLCWKLTIDNIEKLKTSIKDLPETLNYNDFHWSNLALSKKDKIMDAIIFDYHLMGIGYKYSDCRNVINSLEGNAKDAFWEVYGEIDDKEKILDKPVSIIQALSVAMERSQFPQWGKPLLNKIYNGEFDSNIRCALDIID
ncbi:MAG: hypothetical protein ACOCRX_09535 [Candidatus Woesearchaeota archaeon]